MTAAVLFVLLTLHCLPLQAAGQGKNGSRRADLYMIENSRNTDSSTKRSPERVYVSGEPVGLYIRTKGLLVLATQETDDSGEKRQPSKNKLFPGDYILKADQVDLNSGKDLRSFLRKNKNKEIVFTILRKGCRQKVRIRPAWSDRSGSFMIGAWVRSDTQGIGTITCIRPDGRFVALGHGIHDYDLGVSMDIAGGSIYRADISTIMKGDVKKPGEVIGSIDYAGDNYLGRIFGNVKSGVFGKLNKKPDPADGDRLYAVADDSEIKSGKAFLRSSISGRSKDYTVEIEKNPRMKKKGIKTLKIHVTDPELLALTGGIVQGLSGSPLLQDGRLVGAVTHVLVDDPTRGYGITAREMLEEANDIPSPE